MNTDYSQLSEMELVHIIIAGDTDAFAFFWKEYYPRVSRQIRKMLFNEADVEDRATEVMAKVWRKLPVFRGESSLATWIYSITRHMVLNFLKKKRLGEKLIVDTNIEELQWKMVSPIGNPSKLCEGKEQATMLVQALKTLSPKHQEVLCAQMNAMNGKRDAEGARQCGCSQATYRSRLFYARQALLAASSQFKAVI